MALFNPVVLSNRPEIRADSVIVEVATTITPSQLLDARPTRQRGTSFYNISTSALLLRFGNLAQANPATLGPATVRVEAGGFYEMPTAYQGKITGQWTAADASGKVVITEFFDAAS